MTLAQRWRRLRLEYGYGFRDSDIDMYGFAGDRPVEEADRYLGYITYWNNVRPVLNAPSAHVLTENKWVFYRLAAGFGLPIPATLGLYDREFGVTWQGLPLQSSAQLLQELQRVRPAGLVMKPVGGQSARQIEILDVVDYETGHAVTRAGEETTLERVIAGLGATSERGYPGWIIQQTVAQHAAWARLAPWTSNTLRVVTLLTADGQVTVHDCVARFGRRGSTADNWGQGGIAVGVNIGSGSLREGLLRPEYGGARMQEHPDSGVVFSGVQVPHWRQILDVCRRGARLFPGVRSIGWDVLPAPDGPVLLEANADWGLHIVQAQTGGLLQRSGTREELAERGISLPSGGLLAGVVARTNERLSRLVGR